MLRRPRLSKTSVANDVLHLYLVFGPTEISPIFRPQTSPRTKSARIKIMASRIVRGEFHGSAFKAAQSPITASMGISRHAIEFQMQKIDPAAHAARLRIMRGSKPRQLRQKQAARTSSLSSWSAGAPRLQRGHWESLRNDSKVTLCG